MAHDDHAALEQPIPGGVADNYQGYYEAHFGYQYDAEELMSPEERTYKAFTKTASLDTLKAHLQNVSERGALEHLHLVHACLIHTQEELALDGLEQLLARTPYHAAIAYEEVCDAAIALARQDIKRAERILSQGESLFGESWEDRERLAGVIAWREGAYDRAIEAWSAYVADEERVDPERAYDVAEWLAREVTQGPHKETASDFLERSELAAKAQNKRAVLVDIEVLRAELH